MTQGASRWTNGVKKIAGKNWQQVAMDRSKWKGIEDAYIQQWKQTEKEEAEAQCG